MTLIIKYRQSFDEIDWLRHAFPANRLSDDEQHGPEDMR
jgi:hypothetical protein